MFTKRKCVAWGLTFSIFTTGALFAQNYAIDWHTVDGGGEMLCTDGLPGGFELSGTIGQPDANALVMTGGNYTLTGGFWAVPITCACLGDVTGDGTVNGADIQRFVECLLGRTSDCDCADTNGTGGADLNDVLSFVGRLLTGTCP